MGRRTNIDWDALMVDFRLGHLSIKAIARKHGVAESNLRRRIKKEGWSRDCAEVVRTAAQRALDERVKGRAEEIGARIGAEKARAVDAIVDEAVTCAADVIEAHRRQSRFAMNLVQRALEDLDRITTNCGGLEVEIQALAASDPKKAAVLARALGLRAQADTLDRLVSAMAKIASLERQAWGLDKEQEKTSAIDELLMKVHADRTGAKS